MRIRTIKPEFFLHVGLFDLEHETSLPVRLVFAGLWCAADRRGRFRWEPRKLKAQILPYDEVDFSRVLDALATRGFLVRYASQGIEFGWIPTFEKHQIVNNRERESELPSPTLTIEHKELDASGTRDSHVNDACPTRPSLPVPVPVPFQAEGGTGGRRIIPISEVRPRLNALYKRDQSAPWGNDEEHCLVDVAKREHVLDELSEVEDFFKTGNYLPQKLTTLLSGWTGVLDRARNPSRSNSSGPSNGRPATISDLRTVIQFKAEKAKAIKERFSTEGPVSTDWSNNEKKQEYFVLRKEINELKAKAERMVQ